MALDKWHRYVRSGNPALLDELLSEETVFYSPVVFMPQIGAKKIKPYLIAASQILFNESFKYTKQIQEKSCAMLEFEGTLDGIVVNGVDIVECDEEDKFISFKVMVRPLKGIQILHSRMRENLQKISDLQQCPQ